MTAFVLVPGVGLGAWLWRDVTRALRGTGHDVHPLTLTGLAERRTSLHCSPRQPPDALQQDAADVDAVLPGRRLLDTCLIGAHDVEVNTGPRRRPAPPVLTGAAGVGHRHRQPHTPATPRLFSSHP
ncbi:hypothetical protein [Streptomyces sp. NPDC002845]